MVEVYIVGVWMNPGDEESQEKVRRESRLSATRVLRKNILSSSSLEMLHQHDAHKHQRGRSQWYQWSFVEFNSPLNLQVLCLHELV